ncbi:hypothetical protein [Aeromicrobium duanguangcaii]|uniref:Uncharacterized protein n=1 Tax=Aeromicrobium duanguangcaii TaxID=2968086 RepID=A0ABY5KDI9_9ACTN|nr:hypothetical protein [Aeromicrobium duanguangcaii]MCD9152843.1 hypothetical protein [Aeromicrobium duanguangcaii]UUI67177.1 hypothetical protein NP095_08115 [Aeromicrobium duanguangcaii]
MTPEAITLSDITLNAPDAFALARFYAVITQGEAHGTSARARVTGPGGQIGFQQVADPLISRSGSLSDNAHYVS